MIQSRIAALPLLAIAALLVPAAAQAQVCMGLPTTDGQMSIQGEVVSRGTETSYGGRLGMNFNTEFSVDVSLRRPRFDEGNGTSIGARIAYEMPLYEPPVCFLIGIRHDRRPLAGGDAEGTTSIPVGLGIGKRLGSAKGLSLAMFVVPEYAYVVAPTPEGEYDNFWDELGERSEGRGVLGLMLASPFLFATGGVELSTRDDFEPTFSIGLGVIF